ncbi:hypothetical protein ASTA108788_05860 [Asticcacaulis taihuensis]|uniref:Uncharacterized protein n=1 Tax=Asticcacaulis taihuensis TaxID=260084 RepID=A0A1G4PKZ4_9CAUL|nr:hypothetical protein SAMN02927928_0451 [Asticcacaulis taihuensis]
MPQSWPSVKIPESFGGKPPIRQVRKRLRNTLMSVLFCGGLFVAYYQLTGRTPIPPDTHITYEQKDRFRLDIDASGQVILADQTGTCHYQISQFALRRSLRAFHRVEWFDRNILAYGNARSQCLLSLTEGHRKAAIQHDCETQASEIFAPVQSLEVTTRFREVLQGDEVTLRDYKVTRGADQLPSK